MALYRPPSGAPAIDALASQGCQSCGDAKASPVSPTVPPQIRVLMDHQRMPQRDGQDLQIAQQIIRDVIRLGRVVESDLPKGFHVQVAGGRLRRRGASILQNPRLVLLFDNTVTGDYLPWHLYNLSNWIVSGPMAQALSQYGCTPGGYEQYALVDFPRGQISTAQVADFLQAQIAGGAVLPQLPSGNRLYLLFPGPGTLVSDPGFTYGQQWCAYHTVLPYQLRADGTPDPATLVPYGIQPYPTAQGCGTGMGLSPRDALGMTTSHEICEAMTDTVPGLGFTTDDGSESDDVAECVWRPILVSVGGWTYAVQGFWSNARGRCWQPGD